LADYGGHSETERISVDNEGLAIPSLLKIQSGPLGNLGEPPFDGDEMNMHLPQNVLAETELRHLAAIPYQVLTPVGPGPLIGIYQDSLLGSFRFTRPNVKLTPREAMNLLAMFPRVDVQKLLDNKDHLTSFDILSQILPDMTLKYKKDDNVMEIRNGKYVSGQLEKSMLGASTKGLIHRIYNDYGPFAATNFIDDLQQVVTEYMKTSSFSVGISDLIANKVTQEKIVQIITEKKIEVQSELDKLHLGTFKNDTSNSNMVQFETTVNNILNKATELSGKEGRKNLSKDNRFLMIVESGSKGSLVNISQMISCLGQTNVDGKRISYGFEDRTLPHFKKFDDSPGARGFIENSYISGLTAPELFFHAMGGRIGLIDTAVKTSSTGYIQRRLIKGLEDLKVEYDLTVRNNRGKIIQFAYGDDGIDSTRVEAQSVPLVGMSVEDVYMHYDIAGISEESSKDMTAVYTKGTITRLKKQRRETVEKVTKYIERMLEERDALVKGVFRYKDDTMVKVPVSFQHLITNLQGQLGLNSHSSTDLTPLEAFDMVEETFEKLKKLTFAPPTRLFEVLYYFYLTPRELLVHKRFHRKGLELLLDTVVMKYKQSIVHPGEMVGVVAGQSIGEPTTQLTLNSVTYETEIVVRNSKNQIKKVQIGDFVTEHMNKSKKLEYMEDKDTTYAELCPEEEYYEVPSATEDGITVWTRIEAVTQHPVINKDGTDTMIKITTEGCREVIVTKAKSVLQLVDGKIVPFTGSDLQVGDYMPVSIKTVEVAEICSSSMDSYEKIKLVNEIEYRASICNNDIIPNRINGKIIYELRESRVPDLIFDKIVKIEEVPNTTKYAYDLTVAETRNFDCLNGLNLRDTFHLAGVASKSNVTRGVPRIEEILRLTDNPKKPAMTIHLKSVDEADKDRATVYANMLEHTVLRDVVKGVQICFDPLERSTFIESDKKWIETFYAFEDMMKECNEDEDETAAKSKWVVRMELDAEALLERNITMDDVHFAIKNVHSDIQCIYSDYNDEELVFRIRTNADMFKKKKGALQSLDQSDEIYLLRNFQDGLLNHIVLRGVQGIENVIPRKLQNMVAKEDGKYVKKDTWVLDTTGTNMLDVLGTEFIDFKRTYSNDIGEVFDVLGIEAARQIIFNEFSEVMEFSDVNINYHHLSLLCDRMTVTKNMVAIFRSGLHNDNIGPIAKATFEVHTEILLQAARHADFDEMRGVSANVMCGQFGYYGTGAFNVILDMKEMAKQEAKEATVRRDGQDIESGFSQKEDIGCANIRLHINNNITSIHQENEGVCQDQYDMGF
jgi:DNA-directed RNA polymerase beta' subunit